MALLDQTQAQPQFASLTDFLKSPQGLALAGSLLQASGPQKFPISFGQALGNGLQAMQAASASDYENKYRQALTQQTNLQNQQIQQKTANQKAIANVIGTPAIPATAVPYADKPGTGLLGGQLSQDQARTQIAGLLAQENPQLSLTLLGMGPHEYSKPYAGVDAQGNLKYFQTDPLGNAHEVPGFAPLPRTGTSLTVDPATGQISFTQGQQLPVLNPGLVKDPTKGPSRGGQGGTYVDPKTGKVISTDTNRQTSLDQQAIGAIERAKPQIEELANTLPQFQTAAMKAKTGMEGLSNNYLGTNFELPSTAARGKALLQSTPEALIKAYQLNSTDEMAKMVRAIIEPIPGESAYFYKQRVYKSLGDLKLFEGQSKARLANGTTVVEGNNAQPQDNSTNTPQIRTYNPATGKIE